MYVLDFLRTRRVGFETFFHRPASSATRLAGCLHVPGRSVAKSVLVKAGEEFVLAVLPATSRVDLDRLGEALRVADGSVRLATRDEVARIFANCEPGAIPAFGRLYGLRTAVDATLVGAGTIVLGTNLRHLGLRMQFRDYEGLEEPLRVEFGEPITCGPAPTSPRSRGRGGRDEQGKTDDPPGLTRPFTLVPRPRARRGLRVRSPGAWCSRRCSGSGGTRGGSRSRRPWCRCPRA